MTKLQFPEYSFDVRKSGDVQQIFDRTRRKWLVMTPEEHVRQVVVEYVVNALGYPRSLLSLERSLKLSGMSRRADIVIFSRSGRPVMVIECKRPTVAIDRSVFDQAARYNLVFGVSHIVVTNG
ncbi:MAG: type I restriction enzyme HsdR N-terminal domain-containing protein, partial [Flavobacteriales bacterium]|nr:type I restriction enzyme HsdR N-terminal domain-containing protein [Flavobacteriales bacterium]